MAAGLTALVLGCQTQEPAPESEKLLATAAAISGWSDMDIGTVGLAGSSGLGSGVYTINGAGAGFPRHATSDAFFYTYQTLSGDGEIRARVTGVQNTSTNARAALMFRENLGTSARHTTLAASPSGSVEFMSRYVGLGKDSLNEVIPSLPMPWFRLVKVGNIITSYVSDNGYKWQYSNYFEPAGGLPVSMMAGFAVTSGSTSQLNQSLFDNVDFGSPADFSGWLQQDIGDVGSAGSALWEGLLRITGEGRGIKGTYDGFHFFHRSLTGSGEITAFLDMQTEGNSLAMAGVMIRESDWPDSRYAFLGGPQGESVQFLRRTNPGRSPSKTETYAPTGRFLKVSRSGNTFRAFYSHDGVNWIKVGNDITINMAPDVRVGLVVTAADPSPITITPATFLLDNVTVVD